MFACRAKDIRKKEILELIKLLKSSEFANYVHELPGYSTPAPGEIVTLTEALA
jgi:hypothetical protein